MTDLNEYECEMLDTMLEAFGIPDSLTRMQILELFDQDEALAYSMVRALLREGLVMISGSHGDFELPDRLILKPKGEKFLKEGGFTRRYHAEQEKPREVGGTLAKLQQQNMRLQNVKLNQETDIRNLNKKLDMFRIREYIWWGLIALALLVGFLVGRWVG